MSIILGFTASIAILLFFHFFGATNDSISAKAFSSQHATRVSSSSSSSEVLNASLDLTQSLLRTETLSPASLTTISGTTGSGQSITNLHIQDQSGAASESDWDFYIEFLSDEVQYRGYRSYFLPSEIDIQQTISMTVGLNYLGPTKESQPWTWQIYNWSTEDWSNIGENASPIGWESWQVFSFPVSGNAPDYINPITREIRVQVESGNTADNMDLDYESVRVHYKVVPQTTTLLAADLTTLSGATGSGQPVTNLHVQDQSGSQNDWDNYIEFLSEEVVYQGYRTYVLPSQIESSQVISMEVQANYLGPEKERQPWTWQIYNWTTENWSTIGENVGFPGWESWQLLAFPVSGNFSNYINPTTREIRVQVESGGEVDNMDLDYEAVVVHHLGASEPELTAKVTYSSTTALFPNPERGFYRYLESSSSSPDVWSDFLLSDTDRVDWLSAEEESTITQVYCLFVLDAFLTSDISETFLAHIRTNLNSVRMAGKKCILRFAYSVNGDNADGNDLPDAVDMNIADAELSQILSHIEQLKPIFEEYVDIIAVLHAGFIGIWGEWYYTNHFVDDTSVLWMVSDAQHQRRRQVVDALLAALPVERAIALRFPFQKMAMYDQSSPISGGDAHTNTPIARIGYHNDALLNSYRDNGTYRNEADRAYAEAETLYVPMGGEVNELVVATDLSPEELAPSRSCDNVLAEMARYHWSYINTDYHVETLQGWVTEGCIHNSADIEQSIIERLGYRLRLLQGFYPSDAVIGSTLPIRIEITNEGFAAPYNYRPVYLILRNSSTSEEYSFKLAADPRTWLASDQSYLIDESVTLASNIAEGEYQLYLHLPDSDSTIASDARYAIRLANTDLWSATEWDGYNNLLHRIRVSKPDVADTCFGLSLNHSGNGAEPVADPPSSSGCDSGNYLAGEIIQLQATPEDGWELEQWSGTTDDSAMTTSNTVTMPSANHVVVVTYRKIPQSGEGDDYEDDNDCSNYRGIATTGSVQLHTFHEANDEDWVRFEAIKDHQYLIQVDVPNGSAADVSVEVYPECDTLDIANQAATFSPGVRLNFKAPNAGFYYLRLLNQDTDIAGDDVRYSLSIRSLSEATRPGALILVAGSIEADDPVQDNIYHVTDAVYQLFINKGYQPDQIFYIAPDVSRPNVDARAEKATLRNAIKEWAASQIEVEGAVTIYMMDHGERDRFYLDKERGEYFSPSELDEWLTELEQSSRDLPVNVVIDACYSGSFVAGEQSIVGENRVIITSTDEKNLAWASADGAIFSDHFLDALGRNESLFNAYQETKSSVQAAHQFQLPLLNGDTNNQPDEASDGALAATRGFGNVGSLDVRNWPPHIFEAQLAGEILAGEATIQAEVRDDIDVKRVWAEIYLPGYSAPTEGDRLVHNEIDGTLVRSINLLDNGNHRYSTVFDNFNEPGTYRIVVYAEDESGVNARPRVIEVTVGQSLDSGSKIYIPFF